jgi:hypothetical protein
LRTRGHGDFRGKEVGGLKYFDYLLNWTLFVTAIVFMLSIEITRPRSAVLDLPFLWLLVAMMNFVRLRNPGLAVRGLRMSCIGANLIGLITEAARARLWGWAPYTVIAAIAIFGETIFSIVRRNDSNSRAGV